jgi:hypothetical protein
MVGQRSCSFSPKGSSSSRTADDVCTDGTGTRIPTSKHTYHCGTTADLLNTFSRHAVHNTAITGLHRLLSSAAAPLLGSTPQLLAAASCKLQLPS